MNERTIHHYTEAETRETARRLYLEYAGLDLEKPKHRRMMAEAEAAWQAGLSGIEPRAVTQRRAARMSGGVLDLGGAELSCPAFTQIPDGEYTAFLYVVTAGECAYSDDDPITRQLFADIWGTAYVDSARELLDAELARRTAALGDLRLSDSFSPGFYGMSAVESVKLCALLSSKKAIGVEARESGVMVPLKSCSGLYLALPPGTPAPPPACESCKGNRFGCEFCHVRQGG